METDNIHECAEPIPSLVQLFSDISNTNPTPVPTQVLSPKSDFKRAARRPTPSEVVVVDSLAYLPVPLPRSNVKMVGPKQLLRRKKVINQAANLMTGILEHDKMAPATPAQAQLVSALIGSAAASPTLPSMSAIETCGLLAAIDGGCGW